MKDSYNIRAKGMGSGRGGFQGGRPVQKVWSARELTDRFMPLCACLDFYKHVA